jgi:Secretion system C-terminal sorting domain
MVHFYQRTKKRRIIMRKKEISWLIVLVLGFVLSQLQAQTALVVNEKSSKTPLLLSGIQKLTFPTGNMLVTNKGGNTQTFTFSNIAYLSFATLINAVDMQKDEQSQILLYPNPVQDVLNIKYPIASQQTAQLEIIGIDGKIAFKTLLKVGTSNMQLSVSYLPKGFYICRIQTDRKTTSTRFFKQ